MPESPHSPSSHEIATPHNVHELQKASATAAFLALGSETAKKQAAIYQEKILKCAEESLNSRAILGQEH
jgi:hypothetical protein